jgi:hypothetical protein
VEFKNEKQYAKRFQDSEKEFKASKNKLSDFEVNFDKACNNISLLEKEIVNIGDQMQKMNDGEVVVFYPLPLFCNPNTHVKTSCNLNACPFYGLWYVCNNFMVVNYGHTFHPWCVVAHVISSLKCLIVGCELRTFQ